MCVPKTPAHVNSSYNELCRGFSGKDNQFRELPIKTWMAVGGDNQISVEISPCSVEITYYHPTAGSS